MFTYNTHQSLSAVAGQQLLVLTTVGYSLVSYLWVAYAFFLSHTTIEYIRVFKFSLPCGSVYWQEINYKDY